LAHDVTGESRWSNYACLSPDSAGQGVLFGWSTRLFWNRLLIAAPWDFSGTELDPLDTSKRTSGAAYLYEHVGGTAPTSNVPWTKISYVKAPNPDTLDVFGHEVALGNGIVAIGAPRESGGQSGPRANLGDNSISESGAAYVFIDRKSYPIH
jgi:hypothetical protein